MDDPSERARKLRAKTKFDGGTGPRRHSLNQFKSFRVKLAGAHSIGNREEDDFSYPAQVIMGAQICSITATVATAIIDVKELKVDLWNTRRRRYQTTMRLLYHLFFVETGNDH